MTSTLQTPESLSALLRARAAATPSTIALRALTVDGGWSTVTYAELDERVTGLANGLTTLGVTRATPTAFLFSNDAGVEAVISYCAIHRAGGVAVPINARFVAKEIAEIFNHSGIAALLYEDKFESLVAEAAASASRALTLVQAGGRSRNGIPWGSVADAPEPAGRLPEIGPEDLADWLYTSGTTGRPKCAMLTHANCVAAGASLMECFRLEEGDVHLTASPFFTSSGCHTSLLSSITAGATYVMSPSPLAEDLLALIAEESATVVGAVPSIFAYMCNSAALEDADLTKVKLVYHGGAAVNAGLVREIQLAFPSAEVINVYGQTESGNPGTVLRGEWSVDKAGSIGREGMPGVDVQVVDAEGGVVTGAGLGEVCLRSAAVMRGYLDDERETANVLKDGWLYTGDLVKVDDEGFMYLYDRRKDMIVRGGHNVASIEVESALNEHPAVVESAVVGKPHPTLGEDLKAFVVCRPDAPCSVDELRRFCATRLADYKIPRDIEFIGELPRNPTGKILKRELRERLNATQI
ncbi:MAG: fatty-acyl-CoA synthase [Thermoleophilaceae bacterium]|nr:fatty-acyl-CoA synthase [Thermoleophilaceae bacterium]